MASKSSFRYIAYAFLLLNSALWGFSAPIIKYSLNFASPSAFLFYRFIIASLIFLPFFLIHKSRTKHKTNKSQLIILALLGTPLTLLPLFEGLKLTTSIEASILESSSPIFTVLGGLLFLKEKVKPKEWTGLMLAILGTILLAVEPLLHGQMVSLTSFKGNLLIILSNIVWATFLILSKKDKIDSIYLCFYSFLISIPFFFLLSFNEGGLGQITTRALPGILFMAIGGSIIAFWAYQEGQKRIEASEAAIFTYLKPLFSIPLSIDWLKKPFSPVTIIATAIIVSGVYISEKK